VSVEVDGHVAESVSRVDSEASGEAEEGGLWWLDERAGNKAMSC
jgi:hypothetical protein